MSIPHEPTEETRLIVKELYAAGIKQHRIADRLEIDQKTLTKYYKPELDDSFELMVNAVAKNLYQDALNGNEKSREFWLKTRARWHYAVDKDDKTDVTNTLLEKLIDKL